MTETWMQPRDVTGFAAQWRTEIKAARRLGHRVGERYLEVRYEDLVDDAEDTLRRITSFARLPYETALVDYVGHVDVSTKPHQQSLKRPPTAGLRDWRLQMSAEDVGAFARVAGDLLWELGYETHERPDTRGRFRRASYNARTTAWRAASFALRRSPLWRRRHPLLR
jgi:Sulfotransferase family